MKDEVEDFLRRVAQMRAQAEAQSKGQQPTPATPSRGPGEGRSRKSQRQPQSPSPPRLVPERQQPPPFAPAVEPEIIEAELSQRADRVSRQVMEDLRGTDEIAQHTRRLGAEVDAADEKLEAHLHQVFDHQLGRLKKTAIETPVGAPEKPPHEMTLEEIQRLLRSPTSIRDAIIFTEILRRPDW
jgi:hypothetical protein